MRLTKDRSKMLVSLSAISDRYQAFIVDLWGVIHNGSSVHPGALEALSHLRQQGASVCLLSNSPRPEIDVRNKLLGMGVDHAHYDHLVTSGELTVDYLKFQSEISVSPFHGPYFHLGPDNGFGLLDEIPQLRVDELRDASFLLCTGTNPNEVIEDFSTTLETCLSAELTMICANPDLIVHVGKELVICAGTIAARYESMGGNVRYFGKPDSLAYQKCLELLGKDKSSVLAIGDSLHTDVAGASLMDIDVAFVAGGIHRDDLGISWGQTPSQRMLSRLLATRAYQPDHIFSTFSL